MQQYPGHLKYLSPHKCFLQCIKLSDVCNGRDSNGNGSIENCNDGSDELSSTCGYTSNDYLPCPSGDGVVKPHKICNGVQNCYGGWDEENCENYTCTNGYTKCADNKPGARQPLKSTAG